MGKILVVILGAGVVMGAGWYYLTQSRGRVASDVDGEVQVAKPLQNARDAAKRIADDAQRRADELFQRTGD